MKLKVSQETVGNIVKSVGNVLAFGAMFVLPYLSKKDTTPLITKNNIATYDDVIMTIMDSSMLSSDMAKAATMIPKHANSTLYNAVINVINSNMLSSDKIETIKNICSE